MTIQAVSRQARRRFVEPAKLALAMGLTIGTVADSAHSASGIDSEADGILRSMSNYLSGLSALSVNADVDNEIINLAGEKLQFSSSVTLLMQRPDKFSFTRQGPFAETQLFFDGQAVTLSVEDPALYTQIQAPGDIADAIRAIRSEIGLDAPAGDLFYADPYSGLMTDVISGAYKGTAFVQGIECHHLAFRAAKVDWQIWVQFGDIPLPMKYVITSKWVTGAPQYSVRFRNWNSNPEIEADSFAFTPPEGATRIDRVSVNEMGELMLAEDQ